MTLSINLNRQFSDGGPECGKQQEDVLLFLINSHCFLCVCVCVCVCVCAFFSVIQLDSSQTPEPRHILSRHSLPITDLHCGLMGAQARVATASLDQTVKVRLGL